MMSDISFFVFQSQGLTYNHGTLFESTGLYGKSSVRKLDADTGEIIQQVSMPRTVFGEGMAFYGDDRLIQITWRQAVGYIYNASDLSHVIQTFEYETNNNNEGWGITYDGTKDEFIVSDGSDMLHFWDRESLKEKRRIQVHHSDGRHIKNLNELEFWNGYILSNVW